MHTCTILNRRLGRSVQVHLSIEHGSKMWFQTLKRWFRRLHVFLSGTRREVTKHTPTFSRDLDDVVIIEAGIVPTCSSSPQSRYILKRREQPQYQGRFACPPQTPPNTFLPECRSSNETNSFYQLFMAMRYKRRCLWVGNTIVRELTLVPLKRA